MFPQTPFSDYRTRAATAASILSGTNLEVLPGPGTLFVYAGSTVNTATLTVPGRNPGVPVIADAIPLQTSGVPDTRMCPPWVILHKGGQAPIIALGGTTGTCYIYIFFVPSKRGF